MFAALPLVQSKRPELAGLVFAVIAATAVALGKQPNGLAGLLYSWKRKTAAPEDEAVVPLGRSEEAEVADAIA